MSRRTVLLSAVGGIVVLAGGGFGLVEAKVLPGRARLDAALGWDGGSGHIPDVAPGPTVSGTFRSAARGRPVGYSIVRPPGVSGSLPTVVVLHGRAADHTTSFTSLGYDRYLAAAVAGGVPPFALVTVDGGDVVYWHRRADGDDPQRMILDELLPLAGSHGLQVDTFGLLGWSMGGYGALLLAETVGAARVKAVAATSPAIFASYQDASAGSYDSEQDFAANDVIAQAGRLAGIPLRVDCGTDDPFAAMAEKFRAAVHPTPAGGMSRGAHTDAFMTRVAPDQLAFLGRTLQS